MNQNISQELNKMPYVMVLENTSWCQIDTNKLDAINDILATLPMQHVQTILTEEIESEYS